MIPIIETSRIALLDRMEAEREEITSFELMMRASERLCSSLQHIDYPIVIVAGSGNNGGDALCMARLISSKGHEAHTFIVNPNNHLSTDCHTALDMLQAHITQGSHDTITHISSEADLETLRQRLTQSRFVIDGLFGSGLNRPIAADSLHAKVITMINESAKVITAIDIPSGLMGEDERDANEIIAVKATHTLTVEYPKLAMLMPEYDQFVGEMDIVGIDHRLIHEQTDSAYSYFTEEDASRLRPQRPRHAHKGTFGSALLIAGSREMIGAAILSAKAAMRSGIGKLYTLIPEEGLMPMLIHLPEAIIRTRRGAPSTDEIADMIRGMRKVALGPGLGTSDEAVALTTRVITHIACLDEAVRPQLIIDADAINIIAKHRSLIDILPPLTILTPHPAEFDRLTSTHHESRIEMIREAQRFASEHNVNIILKGAFSAIANTKGRVRFNSSGNSGMATAGSGDVLTGILLGLHITENADGELASYGAYIHGKAGDSAALHLGEESIIASDIIHYIAHY